MTRRAASGLLLLSVLLGCQRSGGEGTGTTDPKVGERPAPVTVGPGMLHLPDLDATDPIVCGASACYDSEGRIVDPVDKHVIVSAYQTSVFELSVALVEAWRRGDSSWFGDHVRSPRGLLDSLTDRWGDGHGFHVMDCGSSETADVGDRRRCRIASNSKQFSVVGQLDSVIRGVGQSWVVVGLEE